MAFAGLQSTGWFGARAAFPIRSEEIQCRTRRENASCTQEAKHENKSFIIKGRGSSVVEQPIRNRQVESSTLSLGSTS